MGRKRTTGLAWAFAAVGSVLATREIETPTYQFFSRQDIKAPVFTVSHNTNPAPGYIFVSPFGFVPEEKTNFQYGPYIYDNNGELVWTGHYLLKGGSGVMNHFACEFQGKTHICYSHYEPGMMIQNDVLDMNYNKVVGVAAQGPVAGAEVKNDIHEFNIVNATVKDATLQRDPKTNRRVVGRTEQSAIITSLVHVPHKATLPNCPGTPEVNYVSSCIFQEVALDGSNTVLFEWNSIDHVPVEETNQCLGTEPGITGFGTSTDDPFDYFHLNAIDKDENGDYLISARHTSTIYKIDGKDGHVHWQFGGIKSDFQMLSAIPDVPFEFSYQHHIRFDNGMPGADGVNTFGMTFWNNANSLLDYSDRTSEYSSAMSVLVNMTDMTATMAQLYISPDRQLDSNQGSHQVTPQRSHVLGMGNVPFIAEYNEDYELLFYGNIGTDMRMNSYRMFRYEWEGRPLDKPALFTYSHDCDDQVKWYVSWNGATEVSYWSFFVGNNRTSTDNFRYAGSAHRNRFETTFTGGDGGFAYAMAHDVTGQEIGRSDIVEVFVPAVEFGAQCNDDNCGYDFDYLGAPRKECERHDEVEILYGVKER